jgi:O-antigen/teichoic acid export membrane protein
MKKISRVDFYKCVSWLNESNGLRTQLLRGVIGSVAVQIATIFLSLSLTVLLARTLGPRGYGIYAWVLALVSLIAIPAQFGLPNLVVRETAKAEVNEEWGLMRGLWFWANAIALSTSLGLAIVGGVAIWLMIDQFSSDQQVTLFLGLLLVPLIALGNIRGAALRGLRKVVLGQLPEHILRPGLLIVLIFAIVLILPSGEFLAPHAMGLHAISAAIAFGLGAWILWRVRPEPLNHQPKADFESWAWLAAIFPLALVSSMQLINKKTDILMLGLFATADDVGVYQVVVQVATAVAFGLGVVNIVIAPYFARLYEQRDMIRLQKLVTISARGTLIIALPVVLAFVLLGDHILRIVFGTEFTRGYVALAILTGGQLVNAAAGSVGFLLNMTGHERDTAVGLTVAAFSNVALNLALIPLFGMIGAAIATAMTLVIWNLILWYAVWRRLGINSAAFGRIRR